MSVFTALLAEGILKWNILDDLFDYVVSVCYYVLLVCLKYCISGITYLLLYRNDKYKKLKAEVEKHCKKCKLETEISVIRFENLLDSVYDFILQWRGRRKQQQTCLVDKRRKLVRNYFGGYCRWLDQESLIHAYHAIFGQIIIFDHFGQIIAIIYNINGQID